MNSMKKEKSVKKMKKKIILKKSVAKKGVKKPKLIKAKATIKKKIVQKKKQVSKNGNKKGAKKSKCKGKKKGIKLTNKKLMFCKEYIIDLNGTQAAIRVGYSEKTAQEQASRLLSNVMVQKEVKRLLDKRAKSLDITAERVLLEIARLSYSNMDDFVSFTSNGDPYFDLSKMTREQAAAIESITVEDYYDGRGEDAREVKKIKLSLAKKNPNLNLLCKHLGLITEKHEHTGKDGKPIELINLKVDQAALRKNADAIRKILRS